MKKIITLVLISFLSISILSANTLEQAVEEAAHKLRESGKLDPKRHILSVGMVNFHSKKKDKTALKIETSLYFALEDVNFRTLLVSEALAGSSRNTVFIKGTYESQGEITTLRLQAVKGVLTGEVLAQVCVEYKAKKRRSNVLVAVLDIESTALTGSMKKAFSDLFRSALGRLGGFSLASSADVDKMNPDAIQQATGCTRDECATIIGEQLGVDRVISSSLFELTQNKFMITGKIMDILDGSILQISTVRYEGQIENIDPALEELASKLSGQNNPSELPVVSTKIEQLPKVQTANDDDHSWWKTKLTFSLIACLTTGLYAYSENQEALTQREDLEENESMMTNTNSNIEASNYNDLANKNREAIKTHNQNMQTGLMLSSLLAV